MNKALDYNLAKKVVKAKERHDKEVELIKKIQKMQTVVGKCYKFTNNEYVKILGVENNLVYSERIEGHGSTVSLSRRIDDFSLPLFGDMLYSQIFEFKNYGIICSKRIYQKRYNDLMAVFHAK